MSRVTQKRLRALLAYDPDTGVFIWRVDVYTGRYQARLAAKQGDVAGSIGARGYRLIGVDGGLYRAARLAWFYVTGRWPRHDVDHVNGKRADDRLCNLRTATRSENNQNQRKPRSDNKSGFLGVCPFRGKWHAQIRVAGRRHHLGYYKEPEEAHLVYLMAKAFYHPFATA